MVSEMAFGRLFRIDIISLKQKPNRMEESKDSLQEDLWWIVDDRARMKREVSLQYIRDLIEKPFYDNEKLRGQIEQNEACIRNQTAEIEHLKHELEISKEDVSNLSDLYEEAQEDCKKAQIQLELCQSLLKEKGPKSEFTVREIAIIALALFRKGGVVPKNKKNIAKLFSKMLGVSANTLSVNLCTKYTDKEVQSIANRIKDDMPEFADYLSENKIETEIKK